MKALHHTTLRKQILYREVVVKEVITVLLFLPKRVPNQKQRSSSAEIESTKICKKKFVNPLRATAFQVRVNSQ